MSRALALVDPSDEQRQQDTSNAASPLLETKLYVPRSRSALVARPRLTEAIQNRSGEKLTIVVAPAGFGKTTLLSSWLAVVGVWMFNYFNSQVESFDVEMDNSSSELIDYFLKRSGKAAAR